MTKLQAYNVFMGNAIAKTNSTDDVEASLKEFFEMNIEDLLDVIRAMVIVKFDIQEGDYDTLDKKMREVTVEELIINS